LVKRVM